MRSVAFLVALLCLSACVSIDQLPPGALPAAKPSGAATTFPELDPGNLSITSSHFTLKGYSQYDVDSLKVLAETIFTKIGQDTGIYTFLGSQSYTIVAYRDRDEYLKKTQQPTWSQAVVAGQTIYLYYPNPDLEPVLAHQLTHLVLASYLGERLVNLKWLDEGLAMHQEIARLSESERSAYQSSKYSQLRQNRLAFSQMTFFTTNTEEKRLTDAWFQQVESVVTYLLAQGSPLAFAQFLNALRVVDVDRAIADAYPAKFRSFADLEAAWKYTI